MCTKDRDASIINNMGLVRSLSKKYAGVVGPGRIEDLVQEGNLALIKAVDDFDPEKGISFSTYAWRSIRNAMKRYVISDQVMRLPEYRNTDMLEVAAAVSHLEHEGEPVTVEKVMELTDLDEKTVKELMEHYIRRQTVSMDNVIDETGDEVGSLMTTGESAEDIVMKESTAEPIIRAIREVYGDRHADLITYYYGLGDEVSHTLDETGAKFNVTKERVRQLAGEVNGTHVKTAWQKSRFFMFKEKLRSAGLA